ncbi:MAG: ATP-dependent DNA helicase RecG [Bacteroidia bacterium]|jgi:ATP-dependent DNA helicase RecG
MSTPANFTNDAFLHTSIEYLKGVGSARAEMLKKELGIFNLNDLLFHFPYRHIDRSRIYTIKEIQPELPYIQLKGNIRHIRMVGQKRGQRLVAEFSDATGKIDLVWFQGIKWVKDALKENKEYLIFGKPTEYNGNYNIAHPVLDDPEQADGRMYLTIMPFYTVTERMRVKGLDTRAIMKFTNALVTDSRFKVGENLPAKLIQQYGLMNRQDALIQIHYPANAESLVKAQQRLKFEELFLLQLRLLRFKLKRTQLFNGIRLEVVGDYFNTFYASNLPFELTNAQKRVIKEIRADVKSGKQMNRLLQGDVGSGKTVVALLVLLICIDNGYQGCMMAPTEILAQQHFTTVTELLQGIPIQVRLLTGSTSAKERKLILEGLKDGSIQLLIGTHALIEEIVQFKQLGLAVIDEQHRFGVEQRARLWKKNEHPPHVLVMTATPIPRTLAMTLYGDLDYSVIDELPAGRKPIKTLHQYDSNRLKVYGFIRNEIAKGRQVYIVYPLIAESEKLDYMNLLSGYDEIIRHFPAPVYRICMVHGKMKSADKEREMQLFVSGKAQIMVATTVIEVGVNVPNASVMIIESSERFGLSQLHQLRGRVGRGAEQSSCILMSNVKLSADARLRLKTMVETQNGFEIADVDLRLRGPGELEGTQQSGVLDLRVADLARDYEILQQARDAAMALLNQDPELKLPEHAGLLQFFTAYSKHNRWGRIS